MTFRPPAATQRATLSSNSAFPPLPSTAKAAMVSFPSHLAKETVDRMKVVPDANGQLLTQFVRPVLDKTRRASDDAFIEGWLASVSGLF